MSKQHFTNGHALIIGVGADLAGTINDAEDLANMLTYLSTYQFSTADLGSKRI